MDEITQTDLPPLPATPPVVVAPAPVVYPLVEVVDGYTITTFENGTVVREPVQSGAPILHGQQRFSEFGSKITTDAFYRRLTVAERRRIELASIDPGAAGPARDLAADLRVNQRRLSGATYFDLALAENIAAINGMAAAGLLDAAQHGGASRSAEILATPVTDPLELPAAVRLQYGLPEVP